MGRDGRLVLPPCVRAAVALSLVATACTRTPHGAPSPPSPGASGTPSAANPPGTTPASSDAAPHGAPAGQTVPMAPPPPPASTAGAAASQRPGRDAVTTGARPPLHGGGRGVVSGRAGLVVTVEANATRAGVAMLDAGGTAADAVVAAAYALAVTHPSAGNVGGGGIALYRPRGGPTVAVDFRETAPAAVTPAAFDAMLAARAVGPAAAGVPGSVAGLNLLHARFGRLARARVLSPAITLARDGFVLADRQAKTIRWAWADLSRDPAARRIFGSRGRPRDRGTRLVQPELAATLERIARDGDAGFYAGETASALVALGDRGGLISAADLAGYRAVVREPLRTTYRGYDVELAPPASAGGAAVGIMLRLSEHLRAHELAAGSAEEVHLFAEIARRAHAIRRFEIGDPDTLPGFDVAARSREWFDPASVLARFPPVTPGRATPSRDVHPLFAAAMRELEHTTHLSAIDAEGNVASVTTTLSAGFGSKVVAAGVVLNDSLAAFGTAGDNVLAPRRRMTTSMSPTLVLADGSPALVLGTPGGDTIPNTVTRVLRNLVDHGMTLDLAVGAPRVHHGFVPDEIRYEKTVPLPTSVLAALRRMGHRVAAPTGVMGDANSILVVDGVAHAYADPREGGLALPAGGPDTHASPH